MARIDIAFLALASACLIVGSCLGIYMGIKEDFQLAAVHAHINLAGWASLALFGAIYRLHPELARQRMALLHFWLAAPGALFLPLGMYVVEFYGTPVLAVIGSLLWLAGALVFFGMIIRLALSRSTAIVETSK